MNKILIVLLSSLSKLGNVVLNFHIVFLFLATLARHSAAQVGFGQLFSALMGYLSPPINTATGTNILFIVLRSPQESSTVSVTSSTLNTVTSADVPVLNCPTCPSFPENVNKIMLQWTLINLHIQLITVRLKYRSPSWSGDCSISAVVSFPRQKKPYCNIFPVVSETNYVNTIDSQSD